MESLDSIKETIAKRVKGAFGGTFILIWIIFNWKLLYTIFNFDSDCTLNDKLQIIENYIIVNYPNRLLIHPILFTIFSVFSYNSLNYITYSITIFFGLRVKPNILKTIDSKKVVERHRYDEIEKQLFELDDKYNKEKNNFIRNNDEVETLKKYNQKLTIKNKEKTNELEALKQITDKSEQEIKANFDAKLKELEVLIKEKDTRILELTFDSILSDVSIEPGVLFKGNWKKTFVFPDKKTGTETFLISGKNYLINERVYFEVEYIKAFDNYSFYEIRKRSIENNGILTDKLIKINDTLFIGIENGNISVEYQKL